MPRETAEQISKLVGSHPQSTFGLETLATRPKPTDRGKLTIHSSYFESTRREIAESTELRILVAMKDLASREQLEAHNINLPTYAPGEQREGGPLVIYATGKKEINLLKRVSDAITELKS